MRLLRVALGVSSSAVMLAGCGATPLSALQPAGGDAADIAQLFWKMSVASAVIWAAMMALLAYCLQGLRAGRPLPSRILVVGGGVALPTTALSVLLATALPQLSARVDGPAAADDRSLLRIHVAGEQWWWRVRYELSGGQMVELANELRLPTGRPAHLTLSSDNVIHAFWVPSLAGKIDLLPGRTTYLTLEPVRAGTFRGVCAEYCGTSHAHMGLEVVVTGPAEFDAWLRHQQAPADTSMTHAGGGDAVFAASGCGGCHAIRGTSAAGTIGPDLTHVAGRARLAAAALQNDQARLEAWIRHPARVKPGALMPPFAAVGDERVRALAVYLRSLR